MNIRKFGIVTGSSVGDPTWEIACVEYSELGPVMFSVLDPIKNLIADCERRKAEQIVQQRTLSETLEILGIDIREYMDKRDAWREKNYALERGNEQIQGGQAAFGVERWPDGDEPEAGRCHYDE